jgi:3-phenylpropionate/trans-cinnamate dioxygenase ferredoxin subunit
MSEAVPHWVDAAADDAIAEGGRWFARREGSDIAFFRVQGKLYALEDSCPHAGASLATGKIECTSVTCRAHGLRFDLATGCMRGADGLTARTFPVRIEAGRVLVNIAAPVVPDTP